MAVITITEILGGDNIAGSRITINDNFKRLANAINTIETRLDTSFNPGGSLNVGNALIKRYTNPTSSQIFTCEATGLFQGNLNVLLDLGVTQSADIGLDLDVHRNVTFDGAAVGGPFVFTSSIRSNFAHEIQNAQLYTPVPGVAPILDPQTLPGVGSTRAITTPLVGYSVLRVDLSTYTGVAPFNCEAIQLPVGTNGQILTVIINAPSAVNIATGFGIDTTVNFNTNYAAASFLRIGAASGTISPTVAKLAVTLFYDSLGWRVLSIAEPQQGVAEITY